MPRRGKWMHLAAGIVAGVTLGVFLKLCLRPSSRTSIEACPDAAKLYVAPDPLTVISLKPDETVENSNRTLVFVGVMTAEQYLKTRAKAVFETWAKDLPGRIAFFSSEVSRAPGLPLIPLKNVDDSYPPQKKSFLMLLYMYEKYGEKFEWFMRADDDVYVRGDKLGEFLRSVDSRKPQFIGQAGRGTSAERDALALDYNENFCMGGPGVLISRETLRRVAPHVKYCLKHLYTTHEDVELGRCVAKFAGVSCTWSYDMQTILHHNSSGAAAYTGRLKRREVHRAITLHPVKDHRQMYRLHTYFKNLRILDIREKSLDLHRDIASSLHELGVQGDDVTSYVLPGNVSLFPVKMGQPGYLGNNRILGAPIDFNRYKADTIEDIIPFDFISKSIYTVTHSNPKRRIETPLKEALDDVIREVMEIINAPSRQRGRVIDFNELLYGYTRLQPLHGADHVLDLLLKYRRYRGRKMTAAVRRHAYLQQSFTATEIREIPMGEPPPTEDPDITEQLNGAGNSPKDFEDFDESNQQQNTFLDFGRLNVKEALENSLMKIHENLPNVLKWSDNDYEYPIYDRRIHFILPLMGRHQVFTRFMKNYEDVVLKSDEAVTLIVVLYIDSKNPLDYKNTEALVEHYKDVYGKGIVIVEKGSTVFSRGAALTEGLKRCVDDDLVFFVDVDIMFNHNTLRRIRINTVKHHQVYFPIVFSEYNPEVVFGDDFNKFKFEAPVTESKLDTLEDSDIAKTDRELVNLKYSKEIQDDFGYFRVYGFGIMGIFKCDFLRVGGFDLSIKGWGFEDVQMFETLIKSNLTVYRIPDETLVHIFHSVDCDKNLEKSQFQMCLGTKASTYASQRHMTYYMLNHPDVLWPEKGVS